MWRPLRVKGEIRCTLVDLDGISRREKKAVSFSDGNYIPDLQFSRGETFRFYHLQVKEIKEPDLVTGFIERRREGRLDFYVFLPGVRRAFYHGGQTFSLDPIESEQDFKWDNVSVNKHLEGRIGTVALELSLKILT